MFYIFSSKDSKELIIEVVQTQLRCLIIQEVFAFAKGKFWVDWSIESALTQAISPFLIVLFYVMWTI